MEPFKKSNLVRLRSCHGKYLCADNDEFTVSQSRNGSKPTALWAVELLDDDPKAIKLKSCFNCYLTATNAPFLLGMTGKKVLQMKLFDPDSSITWEPIKEGFSVKLKSPSGSYLRANGRIPPFRNAITHDAPHKSSTQDWLLWEVEPMDNDSVLSFPSSTSSPSTPKSVDSCSTPHKRSPSLFDGFSRQNTPSPRQNFEGRIIRYVVADDDGELPDIFESEFTFKSNDLNKLVEKLKEETGIKDDLYVCGRKQNSSDLYPLRLQLPPNTAPMDLVVVQASSKLARTLLGVGSPHHATNGYNH